MRFSVLIFLSVIALSKLYSLNDPRIAQTTVKGDLIIGADDGKIKTRSRAKQSMCQTHASIPTAEFVMNSLCKKILQEERANSRPKWLDPDQYTIIPAPLKMVKVLIEELVSASGARAAANAAAAAVAASNLDDEDDDDDGWEDEDNVLDLSLGATKSDLMSFVEGGGQRQRDNETQAYLTEFFIRCGQENVANFQEWYNLLSDEEKAKLNDVANSAQ